LIKPIPEPSIMMPGFDPFMEGLAKGADRVLYFEEG